MKRMGMDTVAQNCLKTKSSRLAAQGAPAIRNATHHGIFLGRRIKGVLATVASGTFRIQDVQPGGLQHNKVTSKVGNREGSGKKS
ncbi:hypothetical protein AAFF_G00189470 [Aldrovandia affinis]|uniref:Uncharacterized protein n=1 Tax=Aldrovandia affinis TaxID=143900 RepID=A0AAD7W5W4_9TELE|nr:hypothetical protein AAFF_G00189470 [Aldrovandia affinis]